MHELFQSLGAIAASLFTVAVVLAAALGLGVALLHALRLEPLGKIERATWSITLGLAIGGLAIALLGLLGILYRPLVGLFTLTAAAWGLVCLHNGWLAYQSEQSAPRWSGDSHDTIGAPPRWLVVGLVAMAIVVGLGSLISALAPPTAGDAICYHLELPKVFLAEHRLSYLPFHDNSTFPLLGEMWLLWGLALDGPVAAQLLCWCCGWLLAGATMVLAKPLLGQGWAQIAGLTMVLVPAINNHMAAPLVDLPTALLTTLMLAAWQRGRQGDDDRNWSIVAGGLLGAACGTKYVGLVWGVAWCALTLSEAWRTSERRRELLGQMAVVLVIAVSVGGLWYVRAAYYRGNPVYPLLSTWLPSSVPPPETVDKTPLAMSPLAALTAPWQVTFFSEQFGGRGHRLGVLPLMLLPGLLAARRLRGLLPLLALAALYATGWFVLRQNTRFLFPIVPLLMVGALWSLIELFRWPTLPRRLAFAAIGIVVALDVMGPVRRARDNLAVAAGWESRDAYLMRHEPTYRAACVANAILRDGARILSQDYRAFYFDSSMTRESIYRRVTNYDRALGSEPLVQSLRSRGFTHLLLVESCRAEQNLFDTTLSTLVADAQAQETRTSKRLACLDEYEFVDADGLLRNYRLIELR